MSDKELKTIEDKPTTPEQQAQEFVKEYSALCEKWGFQVIVVPVFVARDDGTFSVKLNSSVGRLPKQE